MTKGIEGISAYSRLEELRAQRDRVAARLPGLLDAKLAAEAAYLQASESNDRDNINALKQAMHDTAAAHYGDEQYLASLSAQVADAETAYNK